MADPRKSTHLLLEREQLEEPTIISSSERPLTSPKPLPVDDGEILRRLQEFDLHSMITERSLHAVSFGGYSDVFKGTCRLRTRRHVRVAIKRLRFSPEALEYKLVSSAPFIFASGIANLPSPLSSYLRKKFTSGPSSSIQTSFHSWGIPSVLTRAILYLSLNGWNLEPFGTTSKRTPKSVRLKF
jgi:hypothetical protein